MRSPFGIDPRLNAVLAPIVGPGRPDADGTIELTVIVDGTIVSGSVVSEEAWSRRQTAQVTGSSEYLAKALEGVRDASTVLPVEDGVRFIHFLEPVVVSGGNPIRLNATRVDVCTISAWSIGRLQYGEL